MNLELSLLCALSGAAIGYLGHRRMENIAIRDSAAKETLLATKLDYISKGVDDIRLDIKLQEKKIHALEERIIILEENNKSLNKRLDTI